MSSGSWPDNSRLWEILSRSVADDAGRLDIHVTAEDFVESISSRTAIRPITAKVAVLANQFLPEYSSDPCDRLIGATALAEGIPLVTKDARIRASKQIRTIW